MPVIMPTPRPQVNYIGNTEVRDGKNSPALDPHGYARKMPTMVTMISPEGEEEQVKSDNVRDYERLKDYKRKVAKNPPPIVGVEANNKEAIAAQMASEGPSVGQSKMDEQKEALDYLGKLRDAAKALGIEPDRRWGIARLREEIKAKGGEIPERAETE